MIRRSALLLLLAACHREPEITRPSDQEIVDAAQDVAVKPNARLVVEGARMKAYGVTPEGLERALRKGGIAVIAPTTPPKASSGGAFEVWMRLPPGKPLGDVMAIELASVKDVPIKVADVAVLEEMAAGYVP